jgi:hypothetical protein
MVTHEQYIDAKRKLEEGYVNSEQGKLGIIPTKVKVRDKYVDGFELNNFFKNMRFHPRTIITMYENQQAREHHLNSKGRIKILD